MNYIVFDLEWNQSPGGKRWSNSRLPFEIIEIGAVKVDEEISSYLPKYQHTCRYPMRRSQEKYDNFCRKCNYIVTATNTKTPLITADMVKPGTHITAMGADGDNKNEVASSVFAKADIIVNDSVSQCEVDGDTSFAIRDGVITADSPVELGLLIKDDIKRANDEQITLVDLTGIAVQDIIVAEMVCDCLLK